MPDTDLHYIRPPCLRFATQLTILALTISSLLSHLHTPTRQHETPLHTQRTRPGIQPSGLRRCGRAPDPPGPVHSTPSFRPDSTSTFGDMVRPSSRHITHILIPRHGLGDTALSEGIAGFIEDIKAQYPGIFVYSVQIPKGGSLDAERKAGFVS